MRPMGHYYETKKNFLDQSICDPKIPKKFIIAVSNIGFTDFYPKKYPTKIYKTDYGTNGILFCIQGKKPRIGLFAAEQSFNIKKKKCANRLANILLFGSR